MSRPKDDMALPEWRNHVRQGKSVVRACKMCPLCSFWPENVNFFPKFSYLSHPVCYAVTFSPFIFFLVALSIGTLSKICKDSPKIHFEI